MESDTQTQRRDWQLSQGTGYGGGGEMVKGLSKEKNKRKRANSSVPPFSYEATLEQRPWECVLTPNSARMLFARPLAKDKLWFSSSPVSLGYNQAGSIPFL